MGFVYRIDAVGIAHGGGFLCPGNPIIMYPGEERDISFRLKNSNDADESVKIKINTNEGNIASFSEGDYTVKAKTYDQEIIFHLKIPTTAQIGEKFNVGFNLFNIPLEAGGGISMTTSLDDSVCVQVGGEYVPSTELSPESEGISNTTWIILGAIVLVIIAGVIIYLIKRKKK